MGVERTESYAGCIIARVRWVSGPDPGLAIGPPRRVVGGMWDYTIKKFLEAAAGTLNVEAVDNDPQKFDSQIEHIAAREETNTLGIYDFDTRAVP